MPPDCLGDRVRDTEVDQYRAGKVLRDKNIGWLDVPVHDSTSMCVVERVGDLSQCGQPIALLGQGSRRAAVDQLHRQPGRRRTRKR